MLALRAINRPFVVTRERPQQHRRWHEIPPPITPGKYRPLEYPEIYAAVKESTPPYDWSARQEDGFHVNRLAAARHYYGPNVQRLTEDMALQFAGRPVYFMDEYHCNRYRFERPRHIREREELISDTLTLGLFSQGSLYEPYLGEYRAAVTCYTYDKALLEHEGIPRSIDPYCAPERVLLIDRSGFVIDEDCEYCFYVLAEKLD